MLFLIFRGFFILCDLLYIFLFIFLLILYFSSVSFYLFSWHLSAFFCFFCSKNHKNIYHFSALFMCFSTIIFVFIAFLGLFTDFPFSVCFFLQFSACSFFLICFHFFFFSLLFYVLLFSAMVCFFSIFLFFCFFYIFLRLYTFFCIFYAPS